MDGLAFGAIFESSDVTIWAHCFFIRTFARRKRHFRPLREEDRGAENGGRC